MLGFHCGSVDRAYSMNGKHCKKGLVLFIQSCAVSTGGINLAENILQHIWLSSQVLLKAHIASGYYQRLIYLMMACVVPEAWGSSALFPENTSLLCNICWCLSSPWGRPFVIKGLIVLQWFCVVSLQGQINYFINKGLSQMNTWMNFQTNILV